MDGNLQPLVWLKGSSILCRGSADAGVDASAEELAALRLQKVKLQDALAKAVARLKLQQSEQELPQRQARCPGFLP